MKKLTLFFTTLLFSLYCWPVAAQGYFCFTGAPRSVWDSWSQPSPQVAATNNVAFLFGSGTPAVAAIMTSVPTNNTTPFSYASAWTAIMNDSNYRFATDAQSNAVAVVQCGSGGSWGYRAGAYFPVAGTSSSGGSATVFVIGWSSAYATPGAAQASGGAVGWSAPFTYNYANSLGTPAGFSAAGLTPFGVGAIGVGEAAAAVPEPGSFALIGLGATALMIFRRRS